MNSNREAISSDGFEFDGPDPKPKAWVTFGDPDPALVLVTIAVNACFLSFRQGTNN